MAAAPGGARLAPRGRLLYLAVRGAGAQGLLLPYVILRTGAARELSPAAVELDLPSASLEGVMLHDGAL